MQLKKALSLSVTAITMVLMILDTEMAFYSAKEGVDICLGTIIPSLFPFFFLSGIINSALIGTNSPLLRPISTLCRIPAGAESLMILGLIGGYPVGASTVYAAYTAGSIKRNSAQRMLAFCNNAGPAFLFGILSPLFENKLALWALWGIHIGSAITVSILLPAGKSEECTKSSHHSITITQALPLAIRNTATVCGWVVLFRIVIGFLDRWFLWLFPNEWQVLLCGFLELSNGCISLSLISADGLRFVAASVLLAFGGICVAMQTTSVIGELSPKSYWFGKSMQTALSLLFAGITQNFLFPESAIRFPFILYLPGVLALTYPILKKTVAFPKNMRYNREKSL